ncbi:hypothetical protein BH11MYX1_BH11MYX1_48350 [soil metagenome]
MIRTIPILVALSLAVSATARADDDVDRILARFADEPTVRDVQVAAIEYYNVSPDTIRTLRARTRSKALVPGLSIGGSAFKQSSSLAVDDIVYRAVGIARFEDQNAVYTGFNASLTWNLDRLVFNAEELDVMSLIGIQDGIQREVTTLYYVRRRLQIEQLLTPPATTAARVSNALRLEELTGLLDAYTGGYLSKHLKKKVRPSNDQ